MRKILKLSAIFSMVGLAFAGGPKVSSDLRAVNPQAAVDVIIQFKHAPMSFQHGKVFAQGGALRQEFQALKGALYTISPKALAALEQDDEVVYISKDRVLHGSATMSYDYTPQTVGSLNYGPTLGSGVGVAVIDSGIAASSDLNNTAHQSRVVYSESFVSGTSDSSDYFGHGTHIAGLIAGNGANSPDPRISTRSRAFRRPRT